MNIRIDVQTREKKKKKKRNNVQNGSLYDLTGIVWKSSSKLYNFDVHKTSNRNKKSTQNEQQQQAIRRIIIRSKRQQHIISRKTHCKYENIIKVSRKACLEMCACHCPLYRIYSVCMNVCITVHKSKQTSNNTTWKRKMHKIRKNYRHFCMQKDQNQS